MFIPNYDIPYHNFGIIFFYVMRKPLWLHFTEQHHPLVVSILEYLFQKEEIPGLNVLFYSHITVIHSSELSITQTDFCQWFYILTQNH